MLRGSTRSSRPPAAPRIRVNSHRSPRSRARERLGPAREIDPAPVQSAIAGLLAASASASVVSAPALAISARIAAPPPRTCRKLAQRRLRVLSPPRRGDPEPAPRASRADHQQHEKSLHRENSPTCRRCGGWLRRSVSRCMRDGPQQAVPTPANRERDRSTINDQRSTINAYGV
jgi:hypothetical protein